MKEERFTVPWQPTEAQWGGLARAIMMWLDMGDKTPRALFQHLARTGEEIPQWLKDEPEMQALNHVPSKGTRCVLIYKAMLEAGRREGLRRMVAADEEMGLYDDFGASAGDDPGTAGARKFSNDLRMLATRRHIDSVDAEMLLAAADMLLDAATARNSAMTLNVIAQQKTNADEDRIRRLEGAVQAMAGKINPLQIFGEFNPEYRDALEIVRATAKEALKIADAAILDRWTALGIVARSQQAPEAENE